VKPEKREGLEAVALEADLQRRGRGAGAGLPGRLAGWGRLEESQRCVWARARQELGRRAREMEEALEGAEEEGRPIRVRVSDRIQIGIKAKNWQDYCCWSKVCCER